MVVSQYNVLIGSETGIVKGYDAAKASWDNLTPVAAASKDTEVTSICWGAADQSGAILGRKNQTVVAFDLGDQALGDPIPVAGGSGSIRGLAVHEDRLVTCVESGHLAVWKDTVSQGSLEVGKDLYCMRQNPHKPHVVATGGKENELKLWDLNTFDANPIFEAKNVKNDWLNLRVPVWVTDVGFLPDSDKIVTATGHNKVRVYDPSTKQRRPVIDVDFDEYPLTSMSVCPDGNSVIVGNTHGNMAMIDLRKGRESLRYKGFAGAIRCIRCHPTASVVVSCGLDRFLHIHDINSRAEIGKHYMKSRLNCLLLTDKWSEMEDSTGCDDQEDDGIEQNLDDGGEDEEDELWTKMDIVETKATKRKAPHATEEAEEQKEQVTSKKKTRKKKL